MKKIKIFFETPKRAVATVACIITILAVLGTGTVFAASTFAEGTSIGAENARNFAFADAGIDPVSANMLRTEFDFEQGQFVYEVEFVADGTEYEYWIKASDGTVVKKELEIISYDGTGTIANAQITLDEAKETALTDAGLVSSEVTFTKAKIDLDDGILVYDIEFCTDKLEYEYEIVVNTGVVYSKSRKNIVAQPAKQTQPDEIRLPQESSDQPGTSQSNNSPSQPANNIQNDSGQISLDTAKSKALADAGVAASEVTYTKARLEHDDGEAVYDIEFYTSAAKYDYEIDALTGMLRSKEAEAFGNMTDNTENSGNSSAYIGVDKAKSIAVNHAGFSGAKVTFFKAKLENDDGYIVYEIEFYKDNMEYEYTIHAVNGSILEYDIERID